jgi:hypothetical protein
VPLRFCRIDNLLGPAVVPGLVECMLLDELYTMSTEELVSLDEVAQDPL